MCREHKVEVSWFSERTGCTTRGASTLQIDHIGSKPTLALSAVHHGVCKVGDMSTCFPHFRVHEYRGIEPYNIVVHLSHFFPPEVTNVVLELDSERTVVP